MNQFSTQQALNLLAGADGTRVIKAAETWAPTDGKKIVAIKALAGTVLGVILDPNGATVSGAGDDDTNTATYTFPSEAMIYPKYYRGGTIAAKYWTSVAVTTIGAVAYYVEGKPEA